MVGLRVGLMVDIIVSLMVGFMVCVLVGLVLGVMVGLMVGVIGGLVVGLRLGFMVGLVVGLRVGFMVSLGGCCGNHCGTHGSDIVQWLMKNLSIEDPAEALHIGSLIAAQGYIFPISDHVLTLKDDGTFYRFQAPYFWPSNCWEPENTDYGEQENLLDSSMESVIYHAAASFP
ncbi:hypothetical protein QTP70_009924 [Hemibagrus guttatus]|uniref:DEP domain-containing protein n=1 Tax=Hemibagrus guttatus TaxID=175788 RepID=A0AAE0USV2_9TELE|nr:hypothetical protein QTP70_009924 [Hemibagrus guttatus]